jgi:hypothetical protein
VILFIFKKAFPLDGGRIIKSLFYICCNIKIATIFSTVFSAIVVIGVAGLAIWLKDISLGLVDVFILIGAIFDLIIVFQESKKAANMEQV